MKELKMINQNTNEQTKSAYCTLAASKIFADLTAARASIAEMKSITYQLNKLIEGKAHESD